MDSEDRPTYLAETSPTIDAKKILNNDWPVDYLSKLEPTNSQEMSGDETISTDRLSEGTDVKKKRCMIYELPPEVIGQMLACLEQGNVANFRQASRQCASYGLEYLFAKGKARLSLGPEVGYRMCTLTEKNICWRIRELILCEDMKEILRLVQNPGDMPFHDETLFRDSGYTLNNLQSLELRLRPRIEIPIYIRLAASQLMFYFLVHLVTAHSSPIVNLRIVDVGWWIHDGAETTLVKAISNLESFELLGDLDSPNHYGDIFSCLQSMTRLRNLVIDFGMTSVNAPWNLSYICELTFDHLRSVRFSNLSVNQQKLLQFFEGHTRLQDIHIGTMLLVDGSWTRSIHAMSQILPDLKNIKFSGLQIFARSEEVHEDGYICSSTLNAWISKFTWRMVGLGRRPREQRVTLEMLCHERSIRKKKAAAGNLRAGDVCDTCGFLEEFCTRLT